MPRVQSITQATFDHLSLGLVTAIRLGRTASPKPSGSDAAAFATSVQLGQPMITVELRTRSLDVAESLTLGHKGDLVFATGPTQAQQPARQVTLAGAVLHAVELLYEQATPACATLRFLAESDSPDLDPFRAEEEVA